MKLRAIALTIAAVLPLQGCLVFIPGQLIDKVSDGITGSVGEHCVAHHAKVGDRVRMPYNGSGIIKELSGTSMRCTSPDMPIRALIVMDDRAAKTIVPEAPKVMAPGDVGDECIFPGSRIGDKLDLGPGRRVVVKEIYGASTWCKELSKPVMASVVFD